MNKLLAIFLLATVALPFATLEVRCDDEEQHSIKRVYSDDLDESSCICGLSKDILDRLEQIVQRANSQQCSLPTNQSNQIDGSGQSVPVTATPPPGSLPEQNQQIALPESTSSVPSGQLGQQVEINSSGKLPGGNWSLSGQTNGHDGDSLVEKLNEQIQALQAQLASLGSKLNPTSSQQPSTSSTGNEATFDPTAPTGERPSVPASISPITGNLSNWGLPSSFISPQFTLQPASNNDHSHKPSDQQETQQQQPQQGSINTGFLQGLTPNSNGINQEQNNQVKPQEVQAAVVSTVPNVVSNIFTNIQNLAIQTEQNPNQEGVSSQANNQLTSIDGSSAQLHQNDTAAQITAQGEQLFLQWIEQQIQAYHMTASMAAYIRKSALNLFRRIVKQYVQRIERLGGAVENNVRQATQLALNNTQNLISFLLRNYLNFAGGLMQIIGEQVSRVGKQLDSTGDTIAHINLNPFDIVSNVFDSLPNPSRYSEYFRAFGKYLMGESSSSQNDQNQQTEGTQHGPNRHTGLFSKTMGALGKTLGSWLG